jgi:hypothetical protein
MRSGCMQIGLADSESECDAMQQSPMEVLEA